MNLEKLIIENNLDCELESKILRLKDAYSTMDINKISDNDVYFIIEWIVFWLDYMEENLDEKKIVKDIESYNERFRDIIMCNDF